MRLERPPVHGVWNLLCYLCCSKMFKEQFRFCLVCLSVKLTELRPFIYRRPVPTGPPTRPFPARPDLTKNGHYAVWSLITLRPFNLEVFCFHHTIPFLLEKCVLSMSMRQLRSGGICGAQNVKTMFFVISQEPCEIETNWFRETIRRWKSIMALIMKMYRNCRIRVIIANFL